MKPKLTFVYDGECPFCNKFAELLELKANIPDFQIRDARDNPSYLPKGYDMDLNGAILFNDNNILYGAEAINFISTQIENPSDSLLRVLAVVFSSNQRTKFLFPILLIARRFTLLLKRKSIKIRN